MISHMYLVVCFILLLSTATLNHAQLSSADHSVKVKTVQVRPGLTSNANSIPHPPLGNKNLTPLEGIQTIYLDKMLGFQQTLLTNDTENDTASSIDPTTLPTEQPTSLPSAQPSTVPSVRPTSMPSSQPSSQPSSHPSSMPSIEENLPTSAPSSQPTTQPSSQPTSTPTQFQPPSASPSGLPSSAPSTQPSSLPTSQPSSSPSSDPSSQPSAVPTRQPFAHPTSHPTAQPIEHPTSRPSSAPSGVPSADPSASPSSMPSPGGEMGVNWWYLVTARCDLYAESPITQHEILDDVVYAFSTGLTDHLNMAERETVEVTAVEISSTSANSVPLVAHRKLAHTSSAFAITKSPLVANLRSVVRNFSLSPVARSQKKHREGNKNQKSYTIETWCPDHPTALKVYQTMEFLATDPSEILFALYERGVTEVVNVTMSSLRLTTSSETPPLDPEELSPIRITYVIIGTLVLFTIAVLIIGNLKHFKYLYCSQTCAEDTARSWGNALADGCMLCLRSVGIVSSDLRLYYGSGFDLTTQEEEADFYGETRSNLPSDNLDIHYGGSHRGFRAKYLEDDDESGGNVNVGGQESNSYALPTSLPPKHGKIRNNIGKLFGKLRSAAGQSNTQSHSGYEPAPSEGSPSPYGHDSYRNNTNSPGQHTSRDRLSPVQGHIEMSERGTRIGRDVVSPLTVPARYAVLSPPPPTPPRRYSNNVFFGNDKNTAPRGIPGTQKQDHRAGSGDTFSPIAMHGDQHFGGSNNPVEDSIDDIGDFTLIPSNRKASSGRQHKHNNEVEDEYESYVV